MDGTTGSAGSRKRQASGRPTAWWLRGRLRDWPDRHGIRDVSHCCQDSSRRKRNAIMPRRRRCNGHPGDPRQAGCLGRGACWPLLWGPPGQPNGRGRSQRSLFRRPLRRGWLGWGVP
jgi:hypothetical protein